jgi:hypothetical protein
MKIMNPNEFHLAEVTQPVLSSPLTGECLSLFFVAGERPDACVNDPTVVGERPAPGHWRLLGIDDERRRAYYARIEHGTASECAARIDCIRPDDATRAGGH